ncbi:MAG TPA: Gfo/Idh/MocA family oxidoreductase [Polyangiaceae bacterium]|jgi:predicted dehydrogenase|nr:Gfo/Idh/MocA family oxidoreductase [Polyangiaceae bacterium]
MLRCLFVGLGGVGQRHLRNLRTLLGQDVEIHAYRVRGERHVIDDKLRIEADADVVEKYGVQVTSSLGAALRQRPDIVFVTNPTSLHVDIALQAAHAGCHLFIEKPLSRSLEGIRELRAVVEERGLVAFVGYQLRRHPGFVHLAKLLNDGVIGRALGASAEIGEYLPNFHPYEDYRRMYASRSDQGGGVTLTQIHEIDCLYALFGMPKRVFSIGGHLSSLELDVEDSSSSLLEYRHSDGKLFPVRLHQDYLQKPPRRRMQVVGENGKLEWNLVNATFEWFGASGELVESRSYADFQRNQLFLDELRYFLDCVRQRAVPDVNLVDGAASLSIALALLESQRTGQPALPESLS